MPANPTSKRVRLVVVALITCVLGLLIARHWVRWEQAADARLVGVWKSDYGQTEWGIARMVLTFNASELQVMMETNRGETMSVRITYAIINGAISSEAINEGQPTRYEIIDGVLRLKGELDGPKTFTKDRLRTMLMW